METEFTSSLNTCGAPQEPQIEYICSAYSFLYEDGALCGRHDD
jgi:hypothetical protein